MPRPASSARPDVDAVFVTGTDTGVGKTLVGSALVHRAAAAGHRALGLKPVASGCEPDGPRLVNEDALALIAAASVTLDYADVNPWAFAPPIAPHVAAAEAGVTLDAAALVAHCRAVLARHRPDFAVVEGAGGWLVPLNDRETLADVAAGLGLPVVLVIGLRLGCINHALLTAAAVRAAGCRLAGWAGSAVDPSMAVREANLAALEARLDAPCLGVVPPLGPGAAAADAAGWLRLPREVGGR